MKQTFLIALLCLGTLVKAQPVEGVVTYEKTYNWLKILDKLTFLSEEERSRAKTTWANESEGEKSKGQLFFNSSHSRYVDMEPESDGGYSWRKREYIITRDFEKETKMEVEEFSGKVYIIEDSLRAPVWKVLNKIREINGYMCMMAVAEDTIKHQKITAWFANDLPTSAGPERYFGLPGLIMEADINDGEVVLTAIKVDKKPVAEEVKITKKMKGKKLTDKEYNAMMNKFISESMKARRNPYWSIRY